MTGSSTISNATDPNKFVVSTNTLLGTAIDTSIPSKWNAQPPVFETDISPQDHSKSKSYKKSQARFLKNHCRKSGSKGIPASLRGAIWIQNVIRSSAEFADAQPYVIEEYGQNKKSSILHHGWVTVLKEIFPDPSDEESAVITDFGVGGGGALVGASSTTDGKQSNHNYYYLHDIMERDHNHGKPIPPGGRQALTRVLYAARYVLGIDYAPLLPDITAVLLQYMSEDRAYTTIRFLSNDDQRQYMPTTLIEHYATCKTFAHVFSKLHPETTKLMERIDALSPTALDPIFKRFLIFKYEHVLRIMDLYTVDGIKVLFRIGTSILCLCKKELKKSADTFQNATQFWKAVRTHAHGPDFDFDDLLKKAYGFRHGGGLFFRRRAFFPRRKSLMELNSKHEEWARQHADAWVERLSVGKKRNGKVHINDDDTSDDVKPMGFVDTLKDEENRIIPITLAKPASVRKLLAQWVPITFQSCRLEMIYSTLVMARTLDNFYKHVRHVTHTILLLEVLNNDRNSRTDTDSDRIIGMYASQEWSTHPRPYGDGQCFLFRVKPNPKCFKWDPNSVKFDTDNNDDDDVTKEEKTFNTKVLMEQFMISKPDFIAMGGSYDGCGYGLRLNEDLSKGESDKAVGFENDPLGGGGDGSKEFEIGLVEVYRFVREVDGKAVDATDTVWNLEGVKLPSYVRH